MIDECRIIGSNRPDLVFLCGGETDRHSDKYLSARHFFQRHVEANDKALFKRLRLAESVNNWFDRETFADLLEVEEYLADLADLIILFVESPGSIAELGAFAVSAALGVKTLAVINGFHRAEGSFIADGPVRRLQNATSDLVQYFTWNPDPKQINTPPVLNTFQNISEELRKILRGRKATATKEQRLDRDSHSHRMLLLADAINIFGIALQTELAECLSEWGFAIDRKRLSQYVFLLQKVGLITAVRYSSNTYLVSRTEKALIRYDYAPAARLKDRERIKLNIRGNLDGTEQKALESHLNHLRRRPRQ
jgi:hypothetical protein